MVFLKKEEISARYAELKVKNLSWAKKQQALADKQAKLNALNNEMNELTNELNQLADDCKRLVSEECLFKFNTCNGSFCPTDSQPFRPMTPC